MLCQHGIELLDHWLFARHDATALHEMPIQRRVILPGGKAAIASPGFKGQARVYPVQVGEHFMNGVAQAVDIQATEFDATFGAQQVIVPV